MGGLGNWLFQVALCEYLKTHGISSKLEISAKSPHSSEEYMDTILKEWKHDVMPTGINFIFGRYRFTEEHMQPYDWVNIAKSIKNVTLVGYFQNYKYITQSFIEKLNLPTGSLKRHPLIQETVFLHIRGGDYLYPQFAILNVNLDAYYEKAISIFPSGTHFSIFTNDAVYSKTKSFLNSIAHTFINESECDSLYLMSQCKGGICANSSFSWWGAYLNKSRKLILPSKWFNDMSLFTGGYYFNEATVLDA
jgi:hypothetical protein